MTPAWPYLAAVWKGVSPYCNMRGQNKVRAAETTHVILHVRSTAVQEQDPTGLVVAALTAQVESGEAAPVLHVDVGLVLAERGHRLAVALPGRLVQSGVAVLEQG